ncbi:polyprenyl synthetase family protein [Leucobacter sp. CSA1]|uniref:Polyprenyl synthetase family protein n=1 Tax=Leucobacter chromiisoli TaxID=2796471 RepID=A0A934Q6L7_9MICO|nr:polyprenyl synthetase family protein [Leucobacter chromiisoli]MBK0419219.1 polyprenyl synthetase family protein [Leucobacter chromiisoli]
MHETTRLAGLIQERITDRLAEHRQLLEPLGPDAAPLLDEAFDFLSGGKRFRAQFAVLGYRAVRPLDLDGEIDAELGRVLDAACALEFFHAAALIHDDVIDRSDTRRGRPAVHRAFASLHGQSGWRGAADHFGLAGAILLGDLLQSWADELMQSATEAGDDRRGSRAAREHFNRMRSEVAVGQYLDVLEEQQPAFADDREQLERSTRVLVYKSAKYSVEAPLLIGGALAGATEEQERALAAFGLPVGVAFQLRDDLLGVFGDEEVTGKPSGGDLTEGKRTVLVTLARRDLPTTQRLIFDDLLGTGDLDDEQIVMLQRTIRDSGAVERVEEMIARNVERATRSLREAPIAEDAAARLTLLAERTTQRSH